jgi:hypothetical protein
MSMTLRPIIFVTGIVALIVFLISSSAVWNLPQAVSKEEDTFAQGVKAYSQGDYLKSERLLSAYLQRNPKSLIRDIGLLWYGRSLIALSRYSEAETIAAILDKEFPNSPLTRKLRNELEKSPRVTRPTVSAKPTSKPPAGKSTGGEVSVQEATVNEAKKAASSATSDHEKSSKATKMPLDGAEKKSGGGVAKQSSAHVKTVEQSQAVSKPGRRTVANNLAGGVLPVPGKVGAKPIQTTQAQPSGTPAAISPQRQEVKSGDKAKPAKILSTMQQTRRTTGKPASGKVISSSGLQPGITKSTTKLGSQRKSGTVKKAVEGSSLKTSLVYLPHRDPFLALVVKSTEETPASPPPGKKGLLVLRLQLKGIVLTGNGNIAVVQSASDSAAFFLREKDSIFDGDVQKIYHDRVVFTHITKDKEGRVHSEEVVRQISGRAMF